MTDHPSTYHADPENVGKIDWDDRASLHLKGKGDHAVDGSTALRRGSLAELVRHMMLLPDEQRQNYVIRKAGDHCLDLPEIQTLAGRDDFPAEEPPVGQH